MAKTMISKKLSRSIKEKQKINPTLHPWHPTEELLDTQRMGASVMKCLLNNDPNGAMEIIEIYLETVNRVQMSKKNRLPRSTLYHCLKNKNPTIKTLAKLMHASAKQNRVA